MKKLVALLALLSPGLALATEDCGEMMAWNPSTGMCEAVPMDGMDMRMAMLHGNLFGGHTWQGGPRAPQSKDAWFSTSMVMADVGTSLGGRHYLNLDLMLTAEKWTLPERGYPLLLQVGERDEQERPFIDAQHPHSSPIMGLTLSDTIRLGERRDHTLKLFFAPRGEATDGPIAFMHRATGEVNPDAPLGHHVGQDVGHITSTVIGASLRLGQTWIEASTFNGREPEPTHVDLPMGKPNSYSARLIRQLSPQWLGMISMAHVGNPEPNEPDLQFVNRYSASAYWEKELSESWDFHNTLIFGYISPLDHADHLASFGEEFLFEGDRPRIWGRIEILQRTAGELGIAAGDSDQGHWVGAVTAGYTHRLANFDEFELGVGGSVTKDILPSEFRAAYGGDPWTGKIFLRLSGMKMWGM